MNHAGAKPRLACPTASRKASVSGGATSDVAEGRQAPLPQFNAHKQCIAARGRRRRGNPAIRDEHERQCSPFYSPGQLLET